MPDMPRIGFVLWVLLVFPALALADPVCKTPGWKSEQWTAPAGENRLSGAATSGEDSGLGGTGIAGDGDGSGLGGTGIFGTITSLASLCVNGEQIHVSPEVEIVSQSGIAVGSEGLAVGQTVWLVAHPGQAGWFTEQIWILPADARPPASSAWLAERVKHAGTLERISLEGPVDEWIGPERFAVHGIVVDIRATQRVRALVEGALQVRVSGALLRDGRVRSDRLSVRPERPVRPPDRPEPRPERPRVDRPPRPKRPDLPVRPEIRPKPPRP
jgi:hypothetical protein